MENKFEQFPQEKFVLVNENRPLRDKELVTKPRGFFADAMYRFSRNKGSIVAACIIGFLFLYAIFAPIFTPYKVSDNDAFLRYALPKIHDNPDVDFYDGCTNKTTNETNFLEYYAIGAETGVNAIKRQAYSTGVNAQGEKTYTFRLDSYRSPGVVFMKGVSREELNDLQNYQDETGIQVIYPITDTAKRPTAPQDLKNANFWYETALIDGRTQPINYTFNEDGTVTYPNIYLEYTKPSLASEQNFISAAHPANARLTPKGAGFTIELTSYTDGQDEEGKPTVIATANYLVVDTEDNMNFIALSQNAEEASTFFYDEINGGLSTQILGHDDATLDGEYLFGIGKERGSNIGIFKIDDYSPDTYVLLNAFQADGKTKITDFSTEKVGYLASVRHVIDVKKNFLKMDMVSLKPTTVNSASASGGFNFVASGDGYVIKTAKPTRYLGVSASGDTNAYTLSDAIDGGSIWKYDSGTGDIYTTINGHANPALDGDYYFVMTINGEETSAGLALKSDFSETVVPFVLYSSGSDKATSLNEGKYYLYAESSKDNSTIYYANGFFNGDNYYSKMRIEGEGNYKYSYGISNGSSFEIRVNYYEYYRYYHSHVLHDRINYPLFIFGANDNGQDIFVCLASGARFSFILAIVVSIVNMTVGAIYGAIEGYYGGKADLIMERIVEILSAVPFMIVITLLKYHMGGTSQALILFIAFFLTGWIGESGLVRMQFYRFKNQEYVLASRTLGARDWRIMFKHIFPNALGTIVTSSVLVIPSMIFSETSLSYLGIINLNTGSMTSVGTLLANGQPYLTTYPHIIIFPAIFISLLMLTFNLFGNGLRDAFNPSLRGTED